MSRYKKYDNVWINTKVRHVFADGAMLVNGSDRVFYPNDVKPAADTPSPTPEQVQEVWDVFDCCRDDIDLFSAGRLASAINKIAPRPVAPEPESLVDVVREILSHDAPEIGKYMVGGDLGNRLRAALVREVM